ncbi:hypothetical protein [Komagataeibacter saccharivorans]|uniref:hypothetical protein n=1 Tax=Komagataeibacter saccharivorans TaxID=265959 RepID=UPI000C838D62|nr:hypothetical protein [Komagataeibacter saccharivorans]
MNATAKLGGLGAVIALLLTEVPDQYTLYAAVFVVACSVAAAIIPPPHAGSRWVVAYQIMTTIGLNIGWAENRLKPGVTALRVSREDKPAAKEAVQAKGIPVLNKQGNPEAPT